MDGGGVLIVDDNPKVLASLGRMAQGRGFAVAMCSGMADALKHLDAMKWQPPVAAIVDVYLERGHMGFELCGRLREHFRDAVPTVMVTAYTGELSYPYVAQEAGFDDDAQWTADIVPVLAKPIRGAVLTRFLARAAANAPLRRAHPAVRRAVAAYALANSLSPQEARIVAQLAAGSTRSSLASDLGLSTETVKSQIRNVLKKCAVTATDELIASVLRYISGTSLGALPVAPSTSGSSVV